MFVHTARDANDGAAWAEQDAELGLFDAFFASLSMILVSEVSSIIHSRIHILAPSLPLWIPFPARTVLRAYLLYALLAG
jgi:hypothetical protein